MTTDKKPTKIIQEFQQNFEAMRAASEQLLATLERCKMGTRVAHAILSDVGMRVANEPLLAALERCRMNTGVVRGISADAAIISESLDRIIRSLIIRSF